MKKTFASVFSLALMLSIVSCGGGDPKTETSSAPQSEENNIKSEPSNYDPKRGEGKFDASNVTLGQLNSDLVTKGESIAGTKCLSCHKTTDEKLVGPGWKGVTSRKTPHWIMNFITNPDPMIDKDPEVQAQLELCLVRMPNQNLNDDEARQILEFMRKNDGIK